MPILRNDLQFRLVGALGAGLVRCLQATWRARLIDPRNVREKSEKEHIATIAAFWHRHLLTMLAYHRGYHVCVPVSEHRDGEYVAHVMDRVGLESVRGSTTHGGIGLLKGLLEKLEEGWSVAVTPDGPRGPRYSVQPGVALLARRSGLPVHPVGIAARPSWEFSSWDRFVLPRPGARIAIVFGEPVSYCEHDGTDAFCAALGTEMHAATLRARQMLRE
ncbi:MAG: DUF374 domain-containing protein [Candidatus Brocadiia bacterium]